MWNSLEIVKLLVAGLVPLTVVGLGVWVTKLTNRLESAQWINQKLVEKRIKLVDDLALDLNDLYCYFLFIGVWKALSPVDVIDRKRRLDRIVYVNRPFLGETCLTTYDAFIKLLFKTFRDPGQDAGLRTTLVSADGNRAADYSGVGEWKPEWNRRFVNNAASRADIHQRYNDLMDQLAELVGVQPRSRTQVNSQNPQADGVEGWADWGSKDVQLPEKL